MGRGALRPQVFSDRGLQHIVIVHLLAGTLGNPKLLRVNASRNENRSDARAKGSEDVVV